MRLSFPLLALVLLAGCAGCEEEQTSGPAPEPEPDWLEPEQTPPGPLSAEAIRESADCARRERPPPLRPFFEARHEGSTLFDEHRGYERVERIVERDGQAVWISGDGAERTLSFPGLSHARFVDDDEEELERLRLLWAVDGEPALRPSRAMELGETVTLPVEGAIDALAVCGAYDRYSGGFTWVAVRHGDAASVLAWPHEDGPVMPIVPTPPASGVHFVCSDALALFVWQDEGRWLGSYCRDARCRALPPLDAGDGLQVAVAFETALFLYGGDDTALARILVDGEALAYGEPEPTLTGSVHAYDRMFVITPPCGGLGTSPMMSTDGRHWEVYVDP